MASLRAARQVALYLLSLLAVASAEIAWLGARPQRLLAHAAALGFTLLLGGFLADALSGLGAAGGGERGRRPAPGGVGGRGAPSETSAGPVAVEQVRRAYLWLFLLALGGGGAVLALARLYRGGESGAALLEDLETRVEAEELLEEPPLDQSRYGAARGRVIRAYLTFLSRARDAGYEIAAHLTPGEIQLRVRQPEAPLADLTGVFLNARYGPDEPSNEAVRIAQRSTRDLSAFLAPRPRPRFRFRSRSR